MNRRWLTLFLPSIFVLAACQPTPVPEALTSTPTPRAVETNVPAPTQTPAVESRLGVDEDALNGLVVDVWHPWYGAPANLFESQVDEFNETILNTLTHLFRSLDQLIRRQFH